MYHWLKCRFVDFKEGIPGRGGITLYSIKGRFRIWLRVDSDISISHKPDLGDHNLEYTLNLRIS